MRPALAYRLQADLRHRRRTLLGLVVLVAILGGTTLATVAGARRTSSAYERLLDVVNPPDLLVSPPGALGADPTLFYEAVADLPEVRQVRVGAGLPLVPEAGTPSERLDEALSGIGVFAAIDGESDADVGRPQLVAGRRPDPQKADEILVTERFARIGELRVGDHIDAVLMTSQETATVQVATRDQGRPIRLTVTGIGVAYDEVIPLGDLNASGSIVATAPLAAMVPRAEWNFEGAYIDAEPGVDIDALAAAIESLGRQEELGTGGPVFVSDQAAATRQVSDAMQPLAVSLAVAAVAISLVALVVVAQGVSRAGREEPDEIDALRAIGVRPGDRLLLAAARAAIVGVAGSVGAILVAWVLSSRFPIGVARVAEPDPGHRLDGAVTVAGSVAIVVLTIGCGVSAAWLGLHHSPRRSKPSRLAGAAAASGLPPAVVQGVRFAVRGGGRRPIPMRSTLVAVSLATASILATAAFGDSLTALIDTPSRYGQGWDRMVDAQFGPAPVAAVVEQVAGIDEVRGVGAGTYGDVEVNGFPVPAFDIETIRGEVSVGIVEGRPATGAGEIVLGGETIDRLDLRVGDTVAVDTGDGTRPMELTGRGVFPHMGQGSFSTTGLGIGAQLTGRSFEPLGALDPVPPDFELDGRRYNFVVIALDGDPSRIDAELAEVEEAAMRGGAFAFVHQEQPPTRIRDLIRVRVVPGMTAGLLAVVAVAALAHLLILSVGERRHELALLRALGFSGRQLQTSVFWQASVIALTAAMAGAPLGVAAGRAVWLSFASGLDAAAPAETPWIWLVAAVPVTLLLANLVAAIPGRTAARTRPATLLGNK